MIAGVEDPLHAVKAEHYPVTIEVYQGRDREIVFAVTVLSPQERQTPDKDKA